MHSQTTRMPSAARLASCRRNLLACALAGSLMLMGQSAMAQSTAATLRGQVSTQAGPAAGVEVVATNIATGSVRRTQASADGSYSLVGLDPGTYRVEAGPGSSRTVTLSVASSATLNLQSGGTELEAVEVFATRLAEVRTSEIGETISLRQIETIPQVSRNFLEFADTVPGMVFSVDSRGHTSLRGGAQNNSSTNVYIDGVGQKSYVKEGGVSGQFNSQGNPFPQLGIGEYKVITSNYKAEYGQIASAAVTAVTKSGTNEFEGEVFYRYTDDGLREKRPDEIAKGEKVESQEKEYGFAVGGPIIEDRLHYFFTYEAKHFNTPITVIADPNAAPGVPFLPPDVADQFGPASLPFEEDLFFGKLDWEVSDSDHIAFTAQIREEAQRDNVGGVNAASHGVDVVNDDKRYTLRWEHVGSRWFNEVLLAHEDAFNRPTPFGLGNGFIYGFGGQANEPTIIAVGPAGSGSAQNKGQKGTSIEDNLTFDDFSWHGDHVIKMGARYKEVKLFAQDASDINPQFYFLVGPDGTAPTPYRASFTKPVAGLGLSPYVETDAEQYGFYIQDDWAVNDHLMFNLGVRWDYEKNPAYLDFVTPANVVAALNSQHPGAPEGQTYAQSLLLGGIDVNDYISTGNNREAFDGAWQPRFGFSYDLNADERHVIHGGAGRSYDRNLYDYLQLEVTKAALPGFTVNFRDPVSGQCYQNRTPCFDWDPVYLNGIANLQALQQSSNAGGEVDLLNNNLEAPYSDQFSIGMSNQIGEWLTDATVARVLSYDGFVFTLGNRFPNGDFFQGGGQPWGHAVPGFGALILGNNGIETRSTQLLLSAQKPYTPESGWSATFAYTHTHASQNRDIAEHYAFDGATIEDYPFVLSNAAAKHRFVAAGSYDGPWGITFGAKLTLATPTPINTVACYGATQPNGAGCEIIGEEPPGSGGFLFGGDVFGYRDFDLQATKEFKFRDDVSVFARVDVLNVFNWKNYSSYTYNFGSGGVFNEDFISINENGDILFVPRTIKFEIGAKF
jgi:outer membrane receptor protein involved in Fe transport